MAFVFGKLAIILLRPSHLLLVLGILAALGLWSRPQAWARALLALVLTIAFAVVLLPVGAWLLTPLENRFPRPDYPKRVDGVVVLGGGVLTEITAARGTSTFADTGERYLALLALARRYPDARMVFTGGVGGLEGGGPPETETVRLLLKEHGLDEDSVLLESSARSTRENALRAKAVAHPQQDEVWLLVTSAAHMPRSIGAFRAVGWPTVAWPVDYRTTGRYDFELNPLPILGRLSELDEAAHEWLGLVYYRLLGWTPLLFPGPATPEGVTDTKLLR